MGAEGPPDGVERRADVGSHIGSNIALWLATGLGAGFSPWAPGTIGSLWGLPLAWSMAHLPLGLRVALIVLLFLIGVPLCTAAARKLGQKDPGAVVWDEIASLPVTFLLVAPGQMNSPAVLATGFLLHRLFDISKPPPARQLESLKDGWGIMADDVVAGGYSCLILHLLLYFHVIPPSA